MKDKEKDKEHGFFKLLNILLVIGIVLPFVLFGVVCFLYQKQDSFFRESIQEIKKDIRSLKKWTEEDHYSSLEESIQSIKGDIKSLQTIKGDIKSSQAIKGDTKSPQPSQIIKGDIKTLEEIKNSLLIIQEYMNTPDTQEGFEIQLYIPKNINPFSTIKKKLKDYEEATFSKLSKIFDKKNMKLDGWLWNIFKEKR